MKSHRLAFVGVGDRGRSLARNASVTCADRITISAFVEPDAQREKSFRDALDLPKVPCFADYRDLIGTGPALDGVVIATPLNTHADIACAFMESGVPVSLEKPMAHNLEDAGRILATVEKTAMRLHVAFNLRYAPFFVKVKELVQSGCLGRILSVEWKEVLSPSYWATYCWHPSYNRREVIGSWLLEKCCHDLDY
jgi:predicted dehydrogenase